MSTHPTTCAYCNAPITQKATGRPRRYCCDSHKQAARHQREIAREVETPIAPDLAPYVPSIANATDEYVAATLLEARRIAGAFTRLGREARPAFAWRCETAAEGITAVLDKAFDGIR
jgi:hypothetical protein